MVSGSCCRNLFRTCPVVLLPCCRALFPGIVAGLGNLLSGPVVGPYCHVQLSGPVDGPCYQVLLPGSVGDMLDPVAGPCCRALLLGNVVGP